MKILDIPITLSSREEILAQVKKFLTEPQFHRTATVNPEFVVLAQKDSTFRQALLSADLCVADGVGIVLAGIFSRQRVIRFSGVDVLHEILVMAEQEQYGVFLAITKDGLSSYEEIKSALLKKYPGLIVDGMAFDMRSNHTARIPHTAYIILCNFGAPEQELFLESLRAQPESIRLAMGVGGSFDFLTSKQKRAPRCLRIIGFEWLWRLILQPSRFKRIWNAVIVFPFLVLLSWQKSKKRV